VGIMEQLVIKAFNSLSKFEAKDYGRVWLKDGVYSVYIYYIDREAESRCSKVYYYYIDNKVYIKVLGKLICCDREW